MAEKDRCVVILSGGPDSSTVAYWAKDKRYDIYAITFKYGQIAEKEVEYARIISKRLGIPIKVVDLNSLREIFIGVAALCDENIEITSTFSKPIIVPFRNAIFLSVGVAYAISINANNIFYGAQRTDEPFYPDCRREFYKSFEKTARLGTGVQIRIKAPFGSLSKSEVLKIGAELGVPFHLTWSCYLDGENHCGRCESCINRKNAFKNANLHDPTRYME